MADVVHVAAVLRGERNSLKTCHLAPDIMLYPAYSDVNRGHALPAGRADAAGAELGEALDITSLSKPHVSGLANTFGGAAVVIQSPSAGWRPYRFVQADAPTMKVCKGGRTVIVHRRIATEGPSHANRKREIGFHVTSAEEALCCWCSSAARSSASRALCSWSRATSGPEPAGTWAGWLLAKIGNAMAAGLAAREGSVASLSLPALPQRRSFAMTRIIDLTGAGEIP
jgi:hypothetical protein